MAINPQLQQRLDTLRQDYRQSGYNTNGTGRDDQTKQETDFRSQEVAIYRLMIGATKPHPASRIHRQAIKLGLLHEKVPITSVRRAISNLCEWGYLTKLPQTVTSPLGKNEHLITINQSIPCQQ